MSRDVVRCSQWLDEELVCCMEDALSLYLSQEQLHTKSCQLRQRRREAKQGRLGARFDV